MSRATLPQTQHETGDEFFIGTKVVGEDGTLGKLKRVVIDPIERAITQLVIESPYRPGGGHLVPVALVTSAAIGEIRLSCTKARFATFDDAEEIQFNPGADGPWQYEQSEMFTLPYYPLGVGMGGMGLGPAGMGMASRSVAYDRIPAGDVEVRRGDPVEASDGAIGHVQGLIVDPSDHGVTHVLLSEGHLWGKRRVSIPIGAVTHLESGIQLSLSKQQVEDLPPVTVGELDD